MSCNNISQPSTNKQTTITLQVRPPVPGVCKSIFHTYIRTTSNA